MTDEKPAPLTQQEIDHKYRTLRQTREKFSQQSYSIASSLEKQRQQLIADAEELKRQKQELESEIARYKPTIHIKRYVFLHTSFILMTLMTYLSKMKLFKSMLADKYSQH